MRFFVRTSTLTIKKKLKQDGFMPIVMDDSKWDELAEAYIFQNYRSKWINANRRHSSQEIAYKLKKKAMEVFEKEYKPEDRDMYLMASK